MSAPFFSNLAGLSFSKILVAKIGQFQNRHVNRNVEQRIRYLFVISIVTNKHVGIEVY